MSLSLPRRFVFPLAGSAAALAVLLGAGPASAQQITIGTAVDRSTPRRQSTYHPDWINYSDCIQDGTLTFTLTLPSNLLSDDLQVWAGGTGTDCTDSTQRTGTASTCWKLYSAQPTAGQGLRVEVSMQDIVGRHVGSGPGSGTAGDCDSSSSQAVSVTLYFMLLPSGGTNPDASQTYALKYDLLGPPAPTNIKTGIAENRLKVSWTASSPLDDVEGYYVFCDPKPGAASTSQPLEAGSPDAAAGTGGTTGSGGAGGSTGATDGGSEAATQNPDCPSSVLITGQRPDGTFRCGDVNGKSSTSTYAEGLTNGTKYNVAVAGYDGVQNYGLLSTVECDTPQIVNDFWDEYTQAGGKGGGGFCGIAARPAPGAGGAFLLALFAGLLRRRRRQRS